MIARLFISPGLEKRVEEIEIILKDFDISTNHPDLLYFPDDSKLGIAEARKIKEHFSLKPYCAKGRVVVLEDASNLTIEAQNALLKTLEEPPQDAMLLLAASSEAKFLPTVLSRCQVIKIQDTRYKIQSYEEEIQKLTKASIEERFEFVEKLKDKDAFLKSLTDYFHKQRNMNFLKELIQAEEWANQNVNIRAVLEYLMLVMPK